MAPATDKAGVIWGWMGNPSMCVEFEVLVMFSEPFGIGDAVTPAKVLEAIDASKVLSVPLPNEAVAAAPLEEGDGIERSVWLETVLVDFEDSIRLLLGDVVDAAAEVIS